MENPQRNPQRLSALYQYHNAPEVAPAHGLEYDETVHSTCSDKYPVPQNNKNYQPPQSSKVYDNDRPPLIIFGMKLRTFLLVAALLVLVVIGAAVGGGVGGRGMHENTGNGMLPIDNDNNDDGNSADASNDDNNNSTNTSTRQVQSHPKDLMNYSKLTNNTSFSPPSATISAAAGTYAGAVPTYEPLDSCPDANNTAYTSTYAETHETSESSSNNTANLTFTLHCGLESPITSLAGAATLSEAFVYSFDDCIELCASLNFWAGNANCSFAAYDVKRSRPGNCWVGKRDGLMVGDLREKDGLAVAILGT